MYKEKVGHTAVRKSTNVDEIIEYMNEQLHLVSDPVDYINYFYFIKKISDFELLHRIKRDVYIDFKTRVIESTLNNSDTLSFSDLLRAFTDTIKLDSSIPLANKFEEIYRKHEAADKEEMIRNNIRILIAIQKSKSPRLYS